MNVLITGANRGIGLELATRCAENGHRVFACCRNPAEAKELAALAASNKSVTVHGLVITSGDSVAALASELSGEPLDVLINNAGTPGPAPEKQYALDMDFDGWADAFAVNTMAPLRMLQAFHPHLCAGTNAKVLNVTSQMGAIAWDVPVMYAYCSTKAALNKLMRTVSKEFAKDGIAVGLVHPGWVRTDMGGAKADISVEESAAGILSVLDALDLESAGSFKKWTGEDHAW